MTDALLVGNHGYTDKSVAAHIELACRREGISKPRQCVNMPSLANINYAVIDVVLQEIECPGRRAVSSEIPQ